MTLKYDKKFDVDIRYDATTRHFEPFLFMYLLLSKSIVVAVSEK